MINKNNIIKYLLIILLLNVGCKKDDSNPVPPSITFKSGNIYTQDNAIVAVGHKLIFGIEATAGDEVITNFTIKKMLSGLSDRERDILVKRYGLEDGVQRTLDEVGYYFNLTRERIRQIEKKSLDKLKTPSKVFMFKKLLEGEST